MVARVREFFEGKHMQWQKHAMAKTCRRLDKKSSSERGEFASFQIIQNFLKIHLTKNTCSSIISP
jgi:hypothetical protein